MPEPDGRDEDDASLLGGDIPFRPMSISEMLDGAIAGIRRRPRATLGLAVAISTVVQVAGSLLAYFLIGNEARDEVTPDPVLRSVGAQFTLGALSLAMSAYGILLLAGLLGPVLGRELLGMPASARRTWRDARPRLGRLAATAALIMGATLLALLVPLAPFIIFLAADAHPVAGVLSAVVGFPAGLALMVWVYVLLVLAAPAVVLERESIGGAFRRARRLSRGRWWRTCGTLLLALLVTVFMGYFALRIPFVIAELIIFGDDPRGTGLVLALAFDTLGRIVSWSVVLPFDAGVIALLYMDRRMRREGLDLELRTLPARKAEGEVSGQEGGEAPDGFFDQWRPGPLLTRPESGARQ